MPVLARDLVDGALVVPGELGGDGVASDWWGSEWPLGGSIDGEVAEPFSAEPDHPIEVGDLDAMPPGPALAERLAVVSPCDVGDAELGGGDRGGGAAGPLVFCGSVAGDRRTLNRHGFDAASF